ncbi:hypothetical protein AQUCO_08200029v1 [Aquilegia coerulea]|uniref:TF-B3 domain-containing protein n=1 Tax=Aquilegia coerulea TaxID=218851 RepID=A0A2G5C7I8_AQUCA|nr:hypothetical protein AQUCO_08200029v1 [Aquilegia coerulea]
MVAKVLRKCIPVWETEMMGGLLSPRVDFKHVLESVVKMAGSSSGSARAINSCEHKPLQEDTHWLWTHILTKSNVSEVFNMQIPKKFHPFLPFYSVDRVNLIHNKQIFKTETQNDRHDHLKFTKGWRDFVRALNLKEGDSCVFEIIKPLPSDPIEIMVQILSGDLPEELITREANRGTSDESPIIID